MTARRKIALGCIGALVLVVSALGGSAAYVTRPDPRFAHAISIERDSVYHDPALLERAWSLPAARLYRPHFESQNNGSFCGPTSLVDVVRSTGGELDQAHVLDGSGIRTVLGFLPGGITLEQVARLAQRRFPERSVTVHRDLDLDGLRAIAREANDPEVRVIANFHRGPLFARGGGHHSPIGGYLEDDDLVFVLDVNHDFQPWLIERERLYAAMDTLDGQKKRGMLLIE